MAKGKRGLKFSKAEMESLLDVIDDIVPIGNPEWERVWDRHASRYPRQERTAESLRRKFQQLVRTKMPTGDPNCPPHIRFAKRIFRKIVKATDGSDGESGNGDFEDNHYDIDGDGGEGGNRDIGDDDEDVGEDDEDGDLDDEEDDGGDVVVPVELFCGSENLFPTEDEPIVVAATARNNPVAAAAIASSSTSSRSSTISGKRASSGGGGGGASKKSRAFKQPLKIPRRSPTSESDDGDGDGFSFGRIMGMMMMQNRADSEQREQQHKKEAEQREQQYKIESEQREREFQLRREEMAIAREDARAQRQMMNMMFMSMLNKNGGDSSNPPPSPSNA